MADFESKLCTRDELKQRVAQLPKPVVMTNGVFDILHRGHVTYLAQAAPRGLAGGGGQYGCVGQASGQGR
jgi:bifunctional ADP-heptose synthase (sugar kinase/adenylyltransferase)